MDIHRQKSSPITHIGKIIIVISLLILGDTDLPFVADLINLAIICSGESLLGIVIYLIVIELKKVFFSVMHFGELL